MPASDPDIPTNTDGFKTSRARYEFNIDRLAQKYGAMPSSGVEIDIKTFDMTGTDKEVKKEFKRLAEVGEKFSFATMSSPVVNATELESTQLAAKCLVLNDIFRSQHQGNNALPAPPTRRALPAPGGGAAAVDSPVTRSRSRAMIEGEPQLPSNGRGGGTAGGRGGGADGGGGSGMGGMDGTPMRPVGGGAGGGRKAGGGGMAVAARAGRTMMVASGARRSAAMMIEEDEPAASGIVARAHTVAGAMMAAAAPDARQHQDGTANAPAAARRAPPMAADADADDAGSGYGGGAGRQQSTPPNVVAVEEPVSARTRNRSRLMLGAATPVARVAAPPVRPAIAAPPPAAAAAPATAPQAAAAKTAPKTTGGRRKTMPQQQPVAEDETPKKGGGRKQSKKAEEEAKKNERKRLADEPAKDVPKKQARMARPTAAAVLPTAPDAVAAAPAAAPARPAAPAAAPARPAAPAAARTPIAAAVSFPAQLMVKRERESNEPMTPAAAAAAPAATAAKSDGSSIEFVTQIYRDANTGRELVCPMETKDDKNDRIEGWLEDSFNRTMSDYGSQDDSAGPSTSTASTGGGDFEKDKDVESFEKNLRRISSSARARNSEMKMGIVRTQPAQRRPSVATAPK